MSNSSPALVLRPVQWPSLELNAQADRRFWAMLVGTFIPAVLVVFLLARLPPLEAPKVAEYTPPQFIDLLPASPDEAAPEQPEKAEEATQTDKPAEKTQEEVKPIETPKPVEKPVVKPIEPVVKAIETPVPVQPPKPTARETAAKAGVNAFADQLSSLRNSGSQTLNSDRTLSANNGSGINSSNGGEPGSAAVAAASGSSGSAPPPPPKNGGGAASQRQSAVKQGDRNTSTAQAAKGINGKKPDPGAGGGDDDSKGGGSRSMRDVQQVMDRNQAGLYEIYTRALRENAELGGVVKVAFTVQPDGSVSDARIVSSQLNDDALESKILLKIKRINFGNKGSQSFTVDGYKLTFNNPNG
jgi:outer membrane biosynthesis protein TonB